MLILKSDKILRLFSRFARGISKDFTTFSVYVACPFHCAFSSCHSVYEHCRFGHLQEAYTRGGTLTDPLRRWCALGLAWMRTSSLDVTATLSSTSSPPKLSVNLPSLLSSAPNREEIIKEVDALVHWTKWTKIRWHIEMRKNILFQQGAGGLAAKVNVDEAVRFVAAALGEDTHGDPSFAAVGGLEATTRASSTKLSLSDQFAWSAF